MEKGSGGGVGGGLLGWLGLLGLLAAVGVAAVLGYLETVRRMEMHEMSLRIRHLQNEINWLSNKTEQLAQQLQTQEKRIAEEKSSPQYYDDNNEYYDEDIYDDYSGSDDGSDASVTADSSSTNRTRRSVALRHLLRRKEDEAPARQDHQVRERRAVGQAGSDRYNLVISQGPRRPAQRVSEVKAVVIIDPRGNGDRIGEHKSGPSTVFRPNFDSTRRTGTWKDYPYRESVTSEVKRPIDAEITRCCSSVAAHFGSNSTLTKIRHESSGFRHEYKFNHRIRHDDGLFMEWQPHAWGDSYSSHFVNSNGQLTILTPGLYYVYAQVFYTDSPDVTGYMIYVNNESMFQCSVTALSHGGQHKMKSNSCYTGGLLRLQNNDVIHIKEIEGRRWVLFEPAKTFFGLFKVSDI